MPLRKQGTFRRFTKAAALALLAAGAVPASSLAASCQENPSSKAFLRYADIQNYSLAPGGDFEQGSPAWTLKSGATVTQGNDQAQITPGTQSMTIPQGATAISPEFCVDETHPTFRFMQRALDNTFGSQLQAFVLYRNTAGQVTQATFQASLSLGFNTQWTPSLMSPLAIGIPLLFGGKTASVQLVFTSARGNWSIDSVMVDPYRRG